MSEPVESQTKLPEIFKAAYSPDDAAAEPKSITLWGVTIDPKHPAQDARVSVILMKFLRARELKVSEAQTMLTATLRWRDEMKIDEILAEVFPDKIFGGVGRNFGHDKEGRPVTYNIYGGDNDVKAVFGDVQRFIRWRIALMENSIKLLDFETIDQMLQIHDYEGVSMTSRDANQKAAASEATSIFQNHYPEFLARKFFINVPTLLTWMFWFFKSILSAKTFAKMSVGDVNEDLQALALDRVLHGQTVIGKTSRTSQIDELKFSDNDLIVVGTLEYGQYGVIDVVTCKLDGKVYARKSIEKRFALKVQDSPTHVSLVMEYAEGGTLWDVLESSPHDGRILERDILWWAPQIVSAIQWCHSQGFVHRDIKPHNFVLNASSRILLIDFGSAAPLLSVSSDGSQQVPKRHCLVPCGTCDYISPEILRCHEEALVALEMSDSPQDLSNISDYVPGGYGRETDWWSCGAMLYEMAYGATPFFASDIRQTYLKIMDHQDLVRRLLTTSELRLGRESVQDIMDHPFFEGIDWDTLLESLKSTFLNSPTRQ
ncbi:hypothetical protein EW026_g5955 [Hermanssonia centrifuga]|uniref:Phosphatidylinositol transfer protein SFH5 n=1 Tax=Hermanssonia centrifuga TaxID=98765 RepID=A0A4S4KCJ8_9APHY|nr:hypothetical protein EW026_g5955 [Hermanssonia centrifuga]